MRPMNKEYISKIEQFVNSYIEEKGVSPVIREITEGTGIARSTASYYLKYMNEHDILEYEGNRRIVTDKMRKAKLQTVQLPVLGAVSCGIPKFAEENIEEYVQVPASWFGSGRFFALRADGDSMINAGIDHGDLVIIRQQSTAETGQIVVALINNEDATLKRYKPHADNKTIDLVPENDNYEIRTIDLSADTLVIQGVAVKVLKDLE